MIFYVRSDCSILITLSLIGLSNLIGLTLAKDNATALIESVSKYDRCMIEATFSFGYEFSRPPRDLEEFKTLCQRQQKAVKCLKEKTKGGPALVRRGLVSFSTFRQRHIKKVCTNFQSEASQKFLEASKCMNAKLSNPLREADLKFKETLNLIVRRNYDDPTVELKQICCSLYNLKKTSNDKIGQECEEHRAVIEELIDQILPSEIKLICEEDEKLAKVCPGLEPIKVPEGRKVTKEEQALSKLSAATVLIYLVETLGQPA